MGAFQSSATTWKDLFGARFEVLLYDLTSTYFESDPDFDPEDKRQFDYRRDKRVQVVITLWLRRKFSHRLRSSGRQHRRQNHFARIPPKDRSSIRQSRSDLGDGPRSHRRSPLQKCVRLSRPFVTWSAHPEHGSVNCKHNYWSSPGKMCDPDWKLNCWLKRRNFTF